MKKMRPSWKILQKYTGLFLYISTFYLAMAVSKYAQTLYFQQNGKLLNFSFAYSAMAVTGALSFLLGNKLVGVKLKQIARMLGLVYAIGMALRVFFQSSLITIVSGGISGIGAAILLLVIRQWIYSEADHHPEDKQMLISSRYTIMQLSSLLATLVAGVILYVFSSSNTVYVIILLLASLAILMLPKSAIPDDKNAQIEKRQGLVVLPRNKKLGVFYLMSVIFMGITTSIVDPIGPAILRSVGFSASITSMIITILGIVAIFSAFIFQRPIFNQRPAAAFLITEAIAGALIICCGLFTSNLAVWTLLAFAIMAFEGTGFFILKELVEYEMFPKTEVTIFLGLAQSGFLIGDAVGAPIGTLLFQLISERYLLIIYGVMAIGCGLAYKYLSKKFLTYTSKS